LITFLALHGNKLELEDTSVCIILAPAIDQVKVAVIGPNAVPQFFVDANDIGALLTRLELLSGGCELSILGTSSMATSTI
jgi:hypothetical protein